MGLLGLVGDLLWTCAALWWIFCGLAGGVLLGFGAVACCTTPKLKLSFRKGPPTPGRKTGTKWVHIAPIPMIFGQECKMYYEESESGLPGPNVLKKA